MKKAPRGAFAFFVVPSAVATVGGGSLPRIDCVTGNLGLKFIKPTPMGVTLTLRARVEGDVGRKTRVICEVYAGEVLTAVGDSVFVRVDTGQLADAAHGR